MIAEQRTRRKPKNLMNFYSKMLFAGKKQKANTVDEQLFAVRHKILNFKRQ